MKGTTKTNLFLDIALFILFLVSFNPAMTGLTVHEWVGLALGGMLAVHFVLHWQWVVTVIKRIFQPIATQARINFVLNLGLLVTFTLVTISGVMISETLGTAQLLGLDESITHGWSGIHHLSSNLTLALVGLHVALHWQWLVTTAKRLLFKRPSGSAAHNNFNRPEYSQSH